MPDLSDAQVMKSIVGLRPYRRGGLRIELDRLPDGRPLVHDVGHGGAGITLAWGSAEEVRTLLGTVVAPPAHVAVLGAGIIGMTAAFVLREAGYTVTLHAEHFTPGTTSDIAGGQFAPSLVEQGAGVERKRRMDRIIRRSHARYVAHIGDHRGVHPRDNYATAGHGTGLSRIPASVIPVPRQLERLPWPGMTRGGRVHKTLLVEPPVYLPRLLEDLAVAGVRFERRRFLSRAAVTGLPARAVVNCLGLGARAVFGDRALTPVKGQLVLLRPQPLPYLLSHEGYLFPRKDAVVLGGTTGWNVGDTRVEPAVSARILRTHRRFFAGSAAATHSPSSRSSSSRISS